MSTYMGSDVMYEVLRERRRQIEVEGWTLEHDQRHTHGELAAAAAAYALADQLGTPEGFPKGGGPPGWWPWTSAWWKPHDRRRNLIRAAALLIAELERLDRADQGGAPT